MSLLAPLSDQLSHCSVQVALVLVAGTCVVIARRVLNSMKSPYLHVPGPKPKSIMGYLPDLYTHDALTEVHFPMADNFGHVARLNGGLFSNDRLYITDPLALHYVLVKEHNNFQESAELAGLSGVINRGDGLPSVWGAEHRKQRRILNPVFTHGHVARLKSTFYKIAYQLRDLMADELKSARKDGAVDVLESISCGSLKFVAQGGLGRSFNSLDKNDTDFADMREALRNVLLMGSRIFFILPFLNRWRNSCPIWLRRAVARLVDFSPWTSAHQLRWCIKALYPVYSKLYYDKKQHMIDGTVDEHGPAAGKDIASLLMQANAVADEEDRMPDDVVIANMNLIVFGGKETTSGAIAHVLCFLVKDHNLQSRLRTEIQDTFKEKGHKELTYNKLEELPLLSAVICEVLRLWPPLAFFMRQTITDSLVPLHFPIVDPVTGEKHHEVLIKKGTPVYVGLGAANHSKAIWGEDADDLKPKRWFGKEKLRDTTVNGVKMPGAYLNAMTFSGGQHVCPGMKFAIFEMKMILAVLLTEFEFLDIPDEIDWVVGLSVSPFARGKEADGPAVPMRYRKLKA